MVTENSNNQLIVECVNSSFINFSNSELNNLVELYLFETDIIRNRFELFLNTISHEELIRAEKFHFEKDKENYIICHGLLRHILSKSINIPPKEIVFNKEENEKPYIVGNNIFFNLSHSKNQCALAVSQQEKIGCDIELTKPNLEYEQIISKFFCINEQEIIRSSIDPLDVFYTFWTRKEAILKATGKGITTHLGDFSVVDGENIFNKKYVTREADTFNYSNFHLYTDKSGNQTISIAAPTPVNIKSYKITAKNVSQFLFD